VVPIPYQKILKLNQIPPPISTNRNRGFL